MQLPIPNSKPVQMGLCVGLVVLIALVVFFGPVGQKLGAFLPSEPKTAPALPQVRNPAPLPGPRNGLPATSPPLARAPRHRQRGLLCHSSLWREIWKNSPGFKRRLKRVCCGKNWRNFPERMPCRQWRQERPFMTPNRSSRKPRLPSYRYSSRCRQSFQSRAWTVG